MKVLSDQTKYFWICRNVNLKSNNNTTNNPNAVYEYDGEGKRVKKFVDGETTIFVYNAGGTLVAEYSTELNPTPKVSYLTSDHLGSPRIITDEAGAVISRHDYMAFGDEVTEKLSNVGGRTSSQGYGEPDDVRKQYTGYERDKESGLDYAQARYYNSNHGRFTSVDPLTASASIRDPQTFNRYSYVLNSPYKFVDPLGLLAQGTGGFCGAENDSCGQGEEITTRSEEEYRRQQAEPPPPPPPPTIEFEQVGAVTIFGNSVLIYVAIDESEEYKAKILASIEAGAEALNSNSKNLTSAQRETFSSLKIIADAGSTIDRASQFYARGIPSLDKNQLYEDESEDVSTGTLFNQYNAEPTYEASVLGHAAKHISDYNKNRGAYSVGVQSPSNPQVFSDINEYLAGKFQLGVFKAVKNNDPSQNEYNKATIDRIEKTLTRYKNGLPKKFHRYLN